jgi:hypothetical protein
MSGLKTHLRFDTETKMKKTKTIHLRFEKVMKIELNFDTKMKRRMAIPIHWRFETEMTNTATSHLRFEIEIRNHMKHEAAKESAKAIPPIMSRLWAAAPRNCDWLHHEKSNQGSLSVGAGSDTGATPFKAERLERKGAHSGGGVQSLSDARGRVSR